MSKNEENRQRFSRTDLQNAARDGWNVQLHNPETNQCIARKITTTDTGTELGIELHVSHEVARECLSEPVGDIRRFRRLLDESMSRELTKTEKRFVRKMEGQ